MIAEAGAFALILALALSVAQVALSVAGRLRRSPTLAGAGEGAALAAFVAVALAFAALMHAFVVSDFSVANVAANSHSEKPLLYRVAGTWGSHEGSMLLWCLALTGFGAAAAGLGRSLPRGLRASTVAAQGVLGTVFLAYTVFASNPLVRLAQPPVEGRSLNPLLQDPALAVHPPFLYAGYVGMSVVFSLAVGALIEGRIDAAWSRWVRPWTLAAWSLLTIGITLGAFWAYYELGWGGWWFWDPVENASFMPWLVGDRAAALRHRHRKARRARRLDRVPVAGRLHLLDAGRLPGALGRADLGARLRRRSDAWRAAADHPGRDVGPGLRPVRLARAGAGARAACSPRSAARARWCSTTSC